MERDLPVSLWLPGGGPSQSSSGRTAAMGSQRTRRRLAQPAPFRVAQVWVPEPLPHRTRNRAMVSRIPSQRACSPDITHAPRPSLLTRIGLWRRRGGRFLARGLRSNTSSTARRAPRSSAPRSRRTPLQSRPPHGGRGSPRLRCATGRRASSRGGRSSSSTRPCLRIWRSSGSGSVSSSAKLTYPTTRRSGTALLAHRPSPLE